MKNFNKLFLKTLILIIFLVVGVITTVEKSDNISKIQNEPKASVTTTVSSFKEISAGGSYDEGRSMAIDTEGNLWIWGCYSHSFNEGSSLYNSNYDPVRILRVKFSVIDEGSSHSLAIDVDQNLWGKGHNSSGQLGNGTKTDNINSFIKIKSGTKFKAVAAGSGHSLAIDSEGNLWTWGYNNYGQLGNGGVTESLVPVKIKSGTKFKAVAAGSRHSLAIDSEGNLWTWGDNNYGQLGDGTTDMSVEPIKIKEGVKFKEISAGEYHSLAIDSEGNLWVWGDNSGAQLGNGSISGKSLEPLQIMSGTTFEKISAGQDHNLAIDSEGKLWVWGYNNYGQLGDGTTTYSTTPKKIREATKFKQVSAGSSHSIALDQYGRMYTWGSDAYGQLGRDGSDYSQKIPQQINASLTLYTVNFMNGENVEKTETVMYKESATAPTLTKEGYTLSWDTDFSSVTSDLTVNAVWTANDAKVTFMNGTETVKTETVKIGGSATAPTLTKAGYTLSWDKAFNNVTSNLTVNAIWTPNTNTAYKVEHYKQNTSLSGYTLAETENKTGTTDSLAVATKKTYEGFTENTSYSGRVPQGTVAGDGSLVLKLYYDRNSYTVTLNPNGGTVNAGNVTSYKYGIGATLPTNVTKTGYTFGGWYANNDLTGSAVTSIGTQETGNKTYYAKWNINQYTVTFKNGAETVKEETVNYGSSVTAPTLTKAGYTLSWDKAFNNVTSNLTVNAIWTANTNTAYKVEHYKQNASLNGYELAETENKTGTTDTTVTATKKTYEGFTENTSYSGRVASGNIAGDGSLVLKLYYDRNSYTVTLNVNGGTINEGNISNYKYGIGAILPTNVTKEGHTFAGWYDNEEFDGNPETKIEPTDIGNKEYYAKWTPNTNTAYKVEHYKQNTSLNGYEKADTEEKTGTTGNQVTAVAKTYEGFTENTSHSERVPQGTVAGNGSLVLKLYYDRNSYNVTLNTNGGTVNEGNISNYKYGIGAILPTNVTKEGHTFAGWYDNEELTGEAVTSIGTQETGNKTYYAKWNINQYTVTFKNGAETAKTETVNYGTSATAPTLTKEGYTLSWDKAFNNVTSDLTVNAIWTPNTNTAYKVEHYLRTTDTEVESYKLHETENKEGATDTVVTAVAKTYEGFTENTSHSGRVPQGTVAGNGSLVLKLYYNRNSYNITYELNGGTANSELTSTYTYGSGLVLSNRVSKEGYVFAGWYANAQLTGETVTKIGTSETGDKTYYAKWIEEQQYYITSEEYSINEQDKQITKISPNTNVTTLINNVETNGIAKVLNLKGEEVTGDSLVGTGYKIQVEFKGTKYEYEIAVRGDLDGNGKVTITDLSTLNQILVKSLQVTGIREKAADLDYSNKVSITDLSMMNQAIVGGKEL